MSSWIRSAVNKAVEVGNKNNLNRIKTYADSVVHQAGQILQDQFGGRNFKSVKQTIKRLEEAAVSCRGVERGILLKRWLLVLKQTHNFLLGGQKGKSTTLEQQQQHVADDDQGNNYNNLSPRKASLFLYYDSDLGGEPMNFFEVFLQSQALEGIILSMILDGPSDEEISLLLEMFGICLTGGKEVHNAIVSSIQDLATVFSGYHDEVLVKREELLQFAQSAVSGLKISADLTRVDAEVSKLKKKLDGINTSLIPSVEALEKSPEATTQATIETLKRALAQIRVCSRLEGLLIKKKTLNNGDSPEIHALKVDKLKVLSESLANSSSKAEKRVSEHRLQKEEALHVRVSKANEATEKEKEIASEISALQEQRDELEEKLKKVNTSLASAQARLHNAREERDQFEEANDQIVAHLKSKENELSKSIAACRVEADVLQTWINFLEDTWVLQCTYTETKEKQANEELESHEDYFVNLATDLLSAYKKELEPSVGRIGKFVENLKKLSGGGEISNVDDEDVKVLSPRKTLEEEYLAYEAKSGHVLGNFFLMATLKFTLCNYLPGTGRIVTTFSVVDNMKEHLYGQQGIMTRKDGAKIKELFDEIEKFRKEFESIERPNLELETPPQKADPPVKELPHERPQPETVDVKIETEEVPKNPLAEKEQVLDPEAELAKLESEFGKVGETYSAEEIDGWEFDELEKELKSGDSGTSK
ncbi:hypothetical protein ACFE04_029156 [Oxalis oulophora]